MTRNHTMLAAMLLLAMPAAAADAPGRFTTFHQGELRIGAACGTVWQAYGDRGRWMDSFVSGSPGSVQPMTEGASWRVVSRVAGIENTRLETILRARPGRQMVSVLAPEGSDSRAYHQIEFRPAGKAACTLDWRLFVDAAYPAAAGADERAAMYRAMDEGTTKKVTGDLARLKAVVERR